MSLYELYNFIIDLKGRKYPELIRPIRAQLNKRPKSPETTINNEFGIKRLLIYLYNVFRRIEINVEKSGSPIFFILENKGLYDARENHKESLATQDILKIYQSTKELYYCYLNYLDVSFKHRTNRYEDNFLVFCTPLKEIIKKLNNWTPSKEDIELCKPKIYLMLPTYSNIQDKLEGITKFKNAVIIYEQNSAQPMISGKSINYIKTIF